MSSCIRLLKFLNISCYYLFVSFCIILSLQFYNSKALILVLVGPQRFSIAQTLDKVLYDNNCCDPAISEFIQYFFHICFILDKSLKQCIGTVTF